MRLRLGLRRLALAFGGLATAGTAVAVAVVIAASGSSAIARRSSRWLCPALSLRPVRTGCASLTKTGSGWRIELSASGVPHLESGRYCQVWLKNAAGDARSGGHVQ
jgi:hypothetical protein